jgi:hypothetical protein
VADVPLEEKDGVFEYIEDAAPALGGPPREAPELGNLIKSYRSRPWWLGVIFFFLVTIFGLPVAIYAFAADEKVLIAPGMITVGLGICGVLIFMLVAPGSFRRVDLHEKGFVFRGLVKTIPVRWDEITGWYNLLEGGLVKSRAFQVVREGKRLLYFPYSPIREGEDFIRRVEATAGVRIRAMINKELDSGKPVAFGDHLMVFPSGMEFRPRGPKGHTLRLKWEQIEKVTHGRFQVNPGMGGLAGAVTQNRMLVMVDGKLEWQIDDGLIANLMPLLEILKHRFGVNVSSS